LNFYLTSVFFFLLF